MHIKVLGEASKILTPKPWTKPMKSQSRWIGTWHQSYQNPCKYHSMWSQVWEPPGKWVSLVQSNWHSDYFLGNRKEWQRGTVSHQEHSLIPLSNTHLMRASYVVGTGWLLRMVSNRCPHEVPILWRKQTVSNDLMYWWVPRLWGHAELELGSRWI